MTTRDPVKALDARAPRYPRDADGTTTIYYSIKPELEQIPKEKGAQDYRFLDLTDPGERLFIETLRHNMRLLEKKFHIHFIEVDDLSSLPKQTNKWAIAGADLRDCDDGEDTAAESNRPGKGIANIVLNVQKRLGKGDIRLVAIHEMGHALGLKHPSEHRWINLFSADRLDPTLDNTNHTVMSCHVPPNGYPSSFRKSDYQALAALYGARSTYVDKTASPSERKGREL